MTKLLRELKPTPVRYHYKNPQALGALLRNMLMGAFCLCFVTYIHITDFFMHAHSKLATGLSCLCFISGKLSVFGFHPDVSSILDVVILFSVGVVIT